MSTGYANTKKIVCAYPFAHCMSTCLDAFKELQMDVFKLLCIGQQRLVALLSASNPVYASLHEMNLLLVKLGR